MFQSRRLSQKIRGQSKENVFNRIISSHLTKFLLIFYCLVKITSGCNPLESVPEKKFISQTPPAKMTTIQKLYRALAYVQLRSVSEFLTFTDEEYKAMETGLIDAIRQLQQRETPLPPTPMAKICISTASEQTDGARNYQTIASWRCQEGWQPKK